MAPSVVKIETIGGLERVGGLLIGTGPTTGVAVSADGYIVSSAFNFVQKPAQMLVQLDDGTRLPAKLVATDHSRMLVLLKVKMPPGKASDRARRRAARRNGGRPMGDRRGPHLRRRQASLSVGIISALNRIWNKAIQTDAKISPNNYGGPLVDIRGRVLGVLVPMSPMANNELAGVEWYDSGIGFAVPLEDINQVLPRLEKGEDLRPGLLGISMKGATSLPIRPRSRPCNRIRRPTMRASRRRTRSSKSTGMRSPVRPNSSTCSARITRATRCTSS